MLKNCQLIDRHPVTVLISPPVYLRQIQYSFPHALKEKRTIYWRNEVKLSLASVVNLDACIMISQVGVLASLTSLFKTENVAILGVLILYFSKIKVIHMHILILKTLVYRTPR